MTLAFTGSAAGAFTGSAAGALTAATLSEDEDSAPGEAPSGLSCAETDGDM